MSALDQLDENDREHASSFAALAVTPHGEVWDYQVLPDSDGRVTTRTVLEVLHEGIDGQAIAVVRLTPEISMWVDEDGSMKPERRVNQLASYVATRLGRAFELFVGVAVFTGGVDRRGNLEPLSGGARATIVSLIDELRSMPGS